MTFTPETLTALVAALGLPVIVPKLIDGYKAWRSGRAQQEKTENRSLLARVIDAEKQIDVERQLRRAWEEFAGRLRYMLTQLGVPDDKLPEEPSRKGRVNQ